MSRINLVLSLSPHGLLRRIVSTGHALRSGSHSIPCALVSAQLRSFGRLVLQNGELQVKGRLDNPGHFDLEISGIQPAIEEWYRGSGDLLIRFLNDICRDFPDQIELIIETERQEI